MSRSKFVDAIGKTREVPLAEFERIWALGGWESGSQQFINCQSHDYLTTRDLSWVEKIDVKRAEMQRLWDTYTYTLSSGPDPLIHWKCNKARYRYSQLSAEVLNDRAFRLGRNNIIRCGYKDWSLSPLPALWDECYLWYSKYPFKNDHNGLLVARNNGDGTVQLFRVPFV